VKVAESPGAAFAAAAKVTGLSGLSPAGKLSEAPEATEILVEPEVRAVVTVAAAVVAAEKPTSTDAVAPASTTTLARETSRSASTGVTLPQVSPLTLTPVGAVAAPDPMKPNTSRF
jgi:hypothetical protein